MKNGKIFVMKRPQTGEMRTSCEYAIEICEKPIEIVSCDMVQSDENLSYKQPSRVMNFM